MVAPALRTMLRKAGQIDVPCDDDASLSRKRESTREEMSVKPMHVSTVDELQRRPFPASDSGEQFWYTSATKSVTIACPRRCAGCRCPSPFRRAVMICGVVRSRMRRSSVGIRTGPRPRWRRTKRLAGAFTKQGSTILNKLQRNSICSAILVALGLPAFGRANTITVDGTTCTLANAIPSAQFECLVRQLCGRRWRRYDCDRGGSDAAVG